MQQNLNMPIFQKEDVVMATGIKPGTLAMWIERGIVTPTLNNPGPGQPRKFSVNDINWIAIIARLAGFMSLSDARDVVASARKLSESDRKGADLKWIFVCKDQQTSKYVVSWSAKDDIKDIWSPQTWHSRNSGVYLVVNVGEIKATVLATLDDGESGELIG